MAKNFLKDVKTEMKKVVWPTKKQLINNTVMVLLLVFLFAVVVLTFDLVVEFVDTKVWNLISDKIN